MKLSKGRLHQAIILFFSPQKLHKTEINGTKREVWSPSTPIGSANVSGTKLSQVILNDTK